MRQLFFCAPLLLLGLVYGCKGSGDGTAHGASGAGVNGDEPKRSLGSIRSALSIYYGDMEGQYPQDLAMLTIGGKYLSAIPKVGPGTMHPASSLIRNGATPTDEGGWLYNNLPSSANAGNVMINCTHTDSKGSAWTTY